MKKNRRNSCGTICRFLGRWMLLVLMTVTVAAGSVSLSETETVQAASYKKIKLDDKEGRYIIDTGANWWLKEKNGHKVSDLQYIKVPSGNKLKSGYYMFDKGRLCKEKGFHKVNTTVIKGKTYKGVYYFGYTNGKLYRKAGWVAINGKNYYLDANGKRLANCWKHGFYLLSNGTIARSQKLSDGTYVDADGRKCTKEQMEISSLRKQLQNMVKGYSGSWSVYVKDLKTGATVTINDRAMYPASTIKAFVMASTFNQIKKGNLSYSATIKSLLRQMITVSDNEAYNQLVRYNSKSRGFVAGTKVVNNYLKANHYTSTGCHQTLHPSSSAFTSDGSRNTASAKDCGVLLEQIYNGKCVSAKYSKEMLNLLKGQTRKWKIPAGLPSGIKSANKTGETSDVQHDMAIVYGKKTDYVISVFSTTGNESYSISRIRNISSVVYKYLNK